MRLTMRSALAVGAWACAAAAIALAAPLASPASAQYRIAEPTGQHR